MHWIIQDCMLAEDDAKELFHVLTKYGIKFSVITIENDRMVLHPDFDELPEADEDVMPIGAYSLMRFIDNHKPAWKKFLFNGPGMQGDVYPIEYGNDMLNSDAVVTDLASAGTLFDHFFIRPLHDNKAFPGSALSRQDFGEWRKRRKSHLITDDLPVLVASIKDICSETRLFIVDKKIITGSLYKMDRKMSISPIIDPIVQEFANGLISREFQPERAYVMDVALINTQAGIRPKVVELNCINCSGFYSANIARLVESLDFIQA